MVALIVWILVDLAGVNADYPPHLELVQAAEVYGWDTGEALGVAWCESQFNLKAVSATGDHGPWQIHKRTWHDSGVFGERTWGRRYTAEGSAAMAFHVWQWGQRTYGDGWILWSCRKF